MVVERAAIPVEDCWNVDALCPSLACWQKDFDSLCRKEKPHWPELNNYIGKLGDPSSLKTILDLCFSIERSLSNLFTYAHLRHDEDITNDEHKVAFTKISSLYQDYSEEISWMEPELLALDEASIKALLTAPELKEYSFHLEKIVRVKKHLLSAEMESLMAKTGKALQASYKAFNAMNDADFNFGEILDGQGERRELTHGSFGVYMRDHDRILRKNAFTQMHRKYGEYENTLCELLNGEIQAHIFGVRARKYDSALDAALFPNNIDTSVYRSLIAAVNEELPSLHRYVALRKAVLGYDELHLYDMSVPLVKDVTIEKTYEEAASLIVDAVAPLGPEYQSLLKKGFYQDRWVDRYENKNKRSGAYSSGSYDSMPYILMNYKNQIRDVFTLAHEAGHSMHSLLTHTHQPYQYGNYSIFLAEVASTFNEELLMQLMLKQASTKEEKIYLINQKIEDIRSTLFRQTMFAEFELLLHTLAEQEVPLTPALLKQEYRKLNEKYFGSAVVIDEEIDIEWARIPHFYYNFYVFQYATGISAALALADRVVHGSNKEREDYLSFLKGGSSRYPIDLLQIAGINMLKPEPVKAATQRFRELVDQLGELLEVEEGVLALKKENC